MMTEEKWPEGYTKVMLPLHQGDTSMLVERVWCKLLSGNDEAGTGIIDNKPVVCEWVKDGDRVTFEDLFPGTEPYAPIVTAVLTNSIGGEPSA